MFLERLEPNTARRLGRTTRVAWCACALLALDAPSTLLAVNWARTCPQESTYRQPLPSSNAYLREAISDQASEAIQFDSALDESGNVTTFGDVDIIGVRFWGNSRRWHAAYGTDYAKGTRCTIDDELGIRFRIVFRSINPLDQASMYERLDVRRVRASHAQAPGNPDLHVYDAAFAPVDGRSVGWIGIQRLKGPYLSDFWECAFYRLNETTAAHDDRHIEKFYDSGSWEFDDSTFCVVTRPRTVGSSSPASSSTESSDDEE